MRLPHATVDPRWSASGLLKILSAILLAAVVIGVYLQRERFNNFIWVALGLALVVAAALWWFRLRRNRKKPIRHQTGD